MAVAMAYNRPPSHERGILCTTSWALKSGESATLSPDSSLPFATAIRVRVCAAGPLDTANAVAATGS